MQAKDVPAVTAHAWRHVVTNGEYSPGDDTNNGQDRNGHNEFVGSFHPQLTCMGFPPDHADRGLKR